MNKILKIEAGLQIFLLVLATFAFTYFISGSLVSAQELEVKADFCCEKTDYNAWCMNSPEDTCQESFKKAPTSCDATSFCKPGCCYESQEGLCMENTPQKVCDNKGGTWADSPECEIPQCELGCCLLDNQAALVTLTRCKKLSGFYGVDTNFRTDITDELECIAVTQAQDKGACVFEEDFSRNCKFTTRASCDNLGGMDSSSEFYKDYLCSAEELATNCGMPDPENVRTTCVEGKDEVYFLDTCGNVANIYDESRLEDETYWDRVVDKSQSCGFGTTNADSRSCGNCDYYLGSLCKQAERGEMKKGDYVCKDLSCYDTSDGKDHNHGESWCSYDGEIGEGRDASGSRHVRHICVGGEEVIEACEDFRQEICIENEYESGGKPFIESACRVNRWRDCIQQDEQEDCENIDKRDCYWAEGASFTKNAEENTAQEGTINGMTFGGHACVPNYPPGLNFWEEGEAESICQIASAKCTVIYEKGLLESADCVENCECLEDEWALQMNQICSSMGDCGGYVNWLGKYTGDGYEWKIDGAKERLKKGSVDSIIARAGIKKAGRLGTLSAIIVPLARGASWLVGMAVASGEYNIINDFVYNERDPLRKPVEVSKTPSAAPVATQSSVSGATTAATEAATANALKGSHTLIEGQGVFQIGEVAESGNLLATPVGGGPAIEITSAAAQGGSVTYTSLPKPMMYGNQEVTGLIQKGAGDQAVHQAITSGSPTTPIDISKHDYSNLGGKAVTGGTQPGSSYLSKALNLPTASGLDALASGLQYAAIGYLAGMLVGQLLGWDDKQTDALSLGLASGLGTWKALSVYGKAGWFGTHAALIGIGVGVFVFLSVYEKEETKEVFFTCMPWQAPTGKKAGNDCEKCNEVDGCSDYKCRSLGQACKLLNEGTEDEKCDWVNPTDTTSPKITLWEEVLTDGYDYDPFELTRPPARGVRVLGQEEECVKAFTPLQFGILTDEPAQCRIDYNHTLKYGDMNYYFGETNLYLYNHTQRMALPSPSAVNATAPELEHNGTYTLYVRCQDANENWNVDEFAIRFCVEGGPDTTPPKIVNTNIANEMPVKYNQSQVDLEVYVNEPAECKWSREDRAYKEMETQMECMNRVWEMNNDFVYTCKTTLTGIKDRNENNFYFRCKDQPWANESDRNTNQQSYEYTLFGSEPLNIIDIKPNGTLFGSTNVVSIFLEIETANGYRNGESICYYSETEEESGYIEFFDTGVHIHQQRLDLVEGSYEYFVKCVDLGGNRDDNFTKFSVEVDNQPPSVSRVYMESELLKIITTENSECTYDIKSCNFKLDDGIEMPYANQTDHVAEWKTDITYYIRCRDEYDNQPIPNSCSLIARPYDIVEQKVDD